MLDERLAEYLLLQKAKREEEAEVSPDEEIRFVTWVDLPEDTVAVERPGNRRGLIEFSPAIINNPKALAAAKIYTLTARERLPELHVHTTTAEQADGESIQPVRTPTLLSPRRLPAYYL